MNITTITIADMNWDSASIQANILKIIIDDGYGFQVELVPGATLSSYNAMTGGGALDIIPALWYNSFEATLAADSEVILVGDGLDGAGEGFYVNKEIAQQYNISSIGDMLKPEVAALFAQDGNLPTLMNAPAGWGAHATNEVLFYSMGLDSQYQIGSPDSASGLDSYISTNLENNVPIFTYYWGPTALASDLVRVSGDLDPSKNDAWDEIANKANYVLDIEALRSLDFEGHKVHKVSTVVSKTFSESNIEVTSFLQNFDINTATLNNLVSLMDTNSFNAEQVALHYLETNSEWKTWATNDAVNGVVSEFTSGTPTVSVGVLLGFTGPIESIVPDMADAAELAFKEVNDSGLLLGGTSIVPIRADSTCIDSSTAVLAAQEIINDDNVVAIVGPNCSGVSGAVASQVSGPSGVLMISPSATSPTLTTVNDAGTFFRTAPSDADQGEVLASRALSHNIDIVEISYIDNDYGLGLANSFATAFNAGGGQVVASTPHSANASSFSPQSTASALAVFGYFDAGGMEVINAAANNGQFENYIVNDGMITDGLKAIEGAFGLLPSRSSDFVGYQAFTEMMTASGMDSSAPYASQSYDAAAVISLAIQAAGSTERSAVLAAVNEVSNSGGTPIYPGQLALGLQILADGGKVDYQGATQVEFDSNGDTTGYFQEVTVVGGALINTWKNTDGLNHVVVEAKSELITGTADADVIVSLGGSNAISASGGNDSITLKSDSVWGIGYAAQNSSSGDSIGTHQTIKLTSLNRFSDIIDGGAQIDALILTDSSDAFFLDDVYSQHHESIDLAATTRGLDSTARIINLETIYAGAGDDIVDLTSVEFALSGAVTVNGGTGNDTLWGADGNDSINGDTGNDTLFGGAGDDTLTGGTGQDTFQFTATSGSDTITDFTVSDQDVLEFYYRSGNISDNNDLTLTDGVLSWATGDEGRTVQIDLSATMISSNLNDLEGLVSFVEIA